MDGMSECIAHLSRKQQRQQRKIGERSSRPSTDFARSLTRYVRMRPWICRRQLRSMLHRHEDSQQSCRKLSIRTRCECSPCGKKDIFAGRKTRKCLSVKFSGPRRSVYCQWMNICTPSTLLRFRLHALTVDVLV